MGTIGIQITAAGAVVPSYADVLAQLRNSYWSIFGTDAQLTPDTQDGQLLAVFAQAITDANNGALAAYNARSPATAQGAGLSGVVKINGLQREAASNSQVVVTIVGVAGTIITGGIVGDGLSLGTQWALPPAVTIPIGGSIDVTATCTSLGATSAGVGTITQIITPTLGWQSVTNAGTATLGSPVETDATLRQRQSASTSLPAQTPVESIYAAIANIAGVSRVAVFENDTDTVNADGIPSHSIAAVALGGDAMAIATAIATQKPPGTGTAGSVTEVVLDQNGVPNTIRYYPLTLVTITVHITIKALTNYVSTTGLALAASIAAFISDFDIGEDSYLNRLWAPANLNGDAATDSIGKSQAELDVLAKTYTVTALTQSRSGPPAVQDVAIAFNEAAVCTPANIVVTVI